MTPTAMTQLGIIDAEEECDGFGDATEQTPFDTDGTAGLCGQDHLLRRLCDTVELERGQSSAQRWNRDATPGNIRTAIPSCRLTWANSNCHYRRCLSEISTTHWVSHCLKTATTSARSGMTSTTLNPSGGHFVECISGSCSELASDDDSTTIDMHLDLSSIINDQIQFTVDGPRTDLHGHPIGADRTGLFLRRQRHLFRRRDPALIAGKALAIHSRDRRTIHAMTTGVAIRACSITPWGGPNHKALDSDDILTAHGPPVDTVQFEGRLKVALLCEDALNWCMDVQKALFQPMVERILAQPVANNIFLASASDWVSTSVNLSVAPIP